MALFDIFSSSVPACSSSSLLPDVLSAARVSSTPTSTPATILPGPGLSTPPVLTQFASALSVSLPHLHPSVRAGTLPPALAHPVSPALPVHAAPPGPPPRVSSPGIYHSSSTSFSQSLQGLALLDLSSSTACVITSSLSWK